jgi:23S rRNA (uracil1939-C5)-methyltransferase
VRLTLEIQEIAPSGEGAGNAGARRVFVPFTSPGDRVEVEVPEGDAPARGALMRVLDPGKARIEPPCPHFGVCGGCEWLHLAYSAQLEAKSRTLAEALRRIGRIDPRSLPMRPIVPSPRPLQYRSRAKFHHDRSGECLVFFQRRSHRSVLLRECHLLEPELENLRRALGPVLARTGLAPREVTIEWSDHLGRGSIWMQFSERWAATERRAEALLQAVPGLQGAILSADGTAPILVGDPILRLQRVPGDPGAGLARSRPDVFQQANRSANALLVEVALELLLPRGADVLELYCGTGNFTAAISARARSVWAVEAQGPALELARADLSGGKVRFFAGDSLSLARAFAREVGEGARRFGAVLLDPPREGAKGIGPVLRDLGLPRVVYVSCDPATMARDLRACLEVGYRLSAVQPVDMFPQTHHVEGVALLEK